ncbi:MAG: inositol monophosphatase family protein [Pseudomonadota bacterium]
MSDNELARQCIERALTQAGELVASRYHSTISVERKLDGTYVSNADLDSNAVIRKVLHSAYPETAMVSEEDLEAESALDLSKKHWIIDPLDGTENFLSGNTHFGVAIGLRQSGRILVGGIYKPISETMITFGDGLSTRHSREISSQFREISHLSEARIACIPTRKTFSSKCVQLVRTKLYLKSYRMIDNWAPSLDWYSLFIGRIDAIVSIRESTADHGYDAQIGEGLFFKNFRDNAFDKTISIPSNGKTLVLQITSRTNGLMSRIQEELGYD